jgi:ankyrin repeat protein
MRSWDENHPDEEAFLRHLRTIGVRQAATMRSEQIPSLALAVTCGWIVAARLLLENGADPDEECPAGWTALCRAAEMSSATATRLLLDHRADLLIGRSAVKVATIAGRRHPGRDSMEVLRLLTAQGVPQAVLDEALLTGVSLDVPSSIVHLLLEAGADPDARTDVGSPSLVVAVQNDARASLVELLRAGADPDAADGAGETALMHAVVRNDESMVAELLAAGADRRITTAEGDTAADIAWAWRFQEVERQLRKPLQDSRSRAERLRDRATERPWRGLRHLGLRASALSVTTDRSTVESLIRLLAAAESVDDGELHSLTGTWVREHAALRSRLAAALAETPGSGFHDVELTLEEAHVLRASCFLSSTGGTAPATDAERATAMMRSIDRQLRQH